MATTKSSRFTRFRSFVENGIVFGSRGILNSAALFDFLKKPSQILSLIRLATINLVAVKAIKLAFCLFG